LLPTIVLTVGFDCASAVLPAVTWTRPPPFVSSELTAVELPSARTDSSRAPAPPAAVSTLPSMLTVVTAAGVGARLRRVGRIGARSRRGRVDDLDVDDAAGDALDPCIGHVSPTLAIDVDLARGRR
jgi:hypothetical protein